MRAARIFTSKFSAIARLSSLTKERCKNTCHHSGEIVSDADTAGPCRDHEDLDGVSGRLYAGMLMSAQLQRNVAPSPARKTYRNSEHRRRGKSTLAAGSPSPSRHRLMLARVLMITSINPHYGNEPTLAADQIWMWATLHTAAASCEHLTEGCFPATCTCSLYCVRQFSFYRGLRTLDFQPFDRPSPALGAFLCPTGYSLFGSYLQPLRYLSSLVFADRAWAFASGFRANPIG